MRFDGGDSYETLDEWLDLSVRRIFAALGEAAAMEVFSSLYATIEPAEALSHGAVFDALERLCRPPRDQRLRSLRADGTV